MSQLDCYLFFDGTCAEAMRFYEKAIGGKIEMMMTQAETPASTGMPPGPADRIMHASLKIGDRILMASDSMPGEQDHGMHGFALSLSYPTPAEGKRVFDALSAGGKVTMPMGPTFWVESFGMLVDRFGTSWMINAGKPAQMG